QGSWGSRLFITPAGNVGIGTTTPGSSTDASHMLHVLGTTPMGYWSGRIIASGPSNAVVIGEGGGGAVIGGHNAALTAWVPLAINPGGGNVGINQPSPKFALDVTGDVNASGSVRASGTALTSDARLKTNVRTIVHALDDVDRLRGVRFD